MTEFKGWAATAAGKPLEPFAYDPGPLGAEDVEIAVSHCGICHSDLSMLQNDWGMTAFPLVPGHEVVGTVTAVGPHAHGVKVGQRVGVGWYANSCLGCHSCISGEQHLCASGQGTIVGRHGGFADRIRVNWTWAIPLPDALDITSAGPLLCGGITVFTPFVLNNISPAAHVAVVGIGGLGHMALKFAKAWGCEVTAFTSSDSKRAEAQSFGADHVIATRDAAAMERAAASFDMIISTVNVPLDWPAVLNTVKPKGTLHVVGAVLEPLSVPAMSLIMAQRSVSGSPTGSPGRIAEMLNFAARRGVAPQVEHFPLSKVNDAMQHLKDGKARYRIVLDVGQ